ncbi:hypothetical protein Nepgr_019327 [Nepenthes gracilis]|uniref:Uncharacterized protein n=1 Tax=Nepenthes gracilis TaxID=150966 RepID=A0AAD3SV16_NEPGR|nr:hypothetical protein Nepgr_019327 [Nepenthes gracilis]
MQNQSGETTLYVAAECGNVDIVKELIKHYDMGSAAIKAKNGYDAFHVAAKQGNLARNGHLEVVEALMRNQPGIAMRIDYKGQTALHSWQSRDRALSLLI